ncbi:hypothetical protein Tco_0785377 [Tanacetum coccineum]
MDLSDIEVPRVFVTCRNIDGRPIRGNDVELLIVSDVFKKLDDNDAVSLCCVGILQLSNDRVCWDNYPWGSYVWPKLYKHLRDANVKRWQPLYASDPTNETDTKTYSIEGFAWAFKGQLPVERLVPDETEARSRWWVSSRAYFDGRSFEDEQIPRHLNRNNYFEVPSEMFMEDMRRVPEANTTPIIADQHLGVSDISGFQSYQGVPSAFHTLANNSSFFNMATSSNWQTPNQSNWLSSIN